MRIAVPDADSQLKRNTAGFGRWLARRPAACAAPACRGPRIGMFGAEMWLRNAFICGVPHAKTITVRMTHGISATRKSVRTVAVWTRRRAGIAAPRRQCREKERQTHHRAARGDDVHQPRTVIVRHEELRNGERHAGDEQRRPHLEHAANA